MKLLFGDCLEQMRLLPARSVSAIVTDPPYGWRFMGKAWDDADILVKAKQSKRPGDFYVGKDGKTRKTCEGAAMAAGAYDVTVTGNRAFQKFSEDWAREAFRVLKPGGHMLVFCGPRTYHRMAAGVEDAGFEIRDQLQWLFGSGFPKSHDISKGLDKRAGAKRKTVGSNPNHRKGQSLGKDPGVAMLGQPHTGNGLITAAVTEAAIRANGWGTALKPANEPIVLARRPFEGTQAQNARKWTNSGGLNIDASRIEFDAAAAAAQKSGVLHLQRKKEGAVRIGGANPGDTIEMYKPGGRWPSNVLLDEEAAVMLDEQASTQKLGRSGGNKAEKIVTDENSETNTFGRNAHTKPGINSYSDSGGASRFFYVAKASKRERNAGLEGMPERAAGVMDDDAYVWPKNGDGTPRNKKVELRANHHPTVKPIKLMEYLIRLITPAGGIVLDPFMGSGSTGVAALDLGFDFIGIERNKEYFEIARKRIQSVKTNKSSVKRHAAHDKTP